MDETTKAYFAGLFDGEGHLGIRKHVRRKDGGIQYGARLSLRLSDEGIVREFAATFGINAHGPHDYARSTLPIYAAEAGGRAAAAILQLLLPYLKIKRRQAELLLQVENAKCVPGGRTRLTSEYIRHMADGRKIPTKSYSFSQELLDQWEEARIEVMGLNRPSRV